MTKRPPVIEVVPGDLSDRNVLFGKRLFFPVWIKNVATSPVIVRTIAAKIEPDSSWTGDPQQMRFAGEAGVELLPGHKEIFSIAIVPPLDCLEHSNFIGVSVTFDLLGRVGRNESLNEVREKINWILVKEVPAVPQVEVFISFVDPENEELARLAAKYFKRAGITPYIAKSDEQCGSLFWADKIEPAIARSSGVLVVWTNDTTRRPKNVQREIEIAKRERRPIGIFLSNGVTPPAAFPASAIEHVRFDPAVPHAPFANAIAAAARRWREQDRLF